MTSIEELKQFAGNMGARVIVLEGQVATLTAQMAAAGVKFMEMDAEINKMKGQMTKG